MTAVRTVFINMFFSVDSQSLKMQTVHTKSSQFYEMDSEIMNKVLIDTL